MLILGIESSCDETAAAVLQDGQKLLSNVIASQIRIHEKYGTFDRSEIRRLKG